MRPTLTHHVLLALLVLACAGLPAPASWAQINALRNKDDQFIQALREQGMSDLLDRFVEADPPSDPIARRTLEVAQQQFRADDTWDRARLAFGGGEAELGQNLLQQSQAAFEGVIKSQRLLIEENPEDERVPIWQTDLASMLLGLYLPRYQRNAAWYYEFGIPSAEQKKAFEDSVVSALEMTADATRRLDLLPGRVGAEPALRLKLEELGVWYKLQQQYIKLLTPMWFGHATHYASLLPSDHPYYRTLGTNVYVKGQGANPEAEKKRLRELTQFTLRGELLERSESKQIAQLLIGSSMVWMGGRNNADLAVAEYLDAVIAEANNSYFGYLATLARAVARKQAGDLDTAVDILKGIGTHPYLQQDTSIHPRLVAADLMHRLLMEPAEKAQGEQRRALIARAYTEPYLPLIKDDSGIYAAFLYDRWASNTKPDQDPADLPPLVRMGIGERLGQRGIRAAFETIQIAQSQGDQQAIDSPTYAQANELFEQANTYNLSLADPATDEGVRARALSNLGNNRIMKFQMENELRNGQVGTDLLKAIAEAFAPIVLELPNSAEAEKASQEALRYLQFLDHGLNVSQGRVTSPAIREMYVKVAEATFANWSQTEMAHNNRSYIGAYIYEPQKQWDKAVAVYRDCPPEHRSYFECRTQMMWVLRRQYRDLLDEVEVMENTPPADDAAAELKQTYARQLADQKETLDRVRRELLEDANHLRAIAERSVQDESDARIRFGALTALGAAKVVGSLMLGDSGQTDDALAVLEGFEQQFSPEGEYKELIGQQSNVQNATDNMNGLIRSALESRILALVRGKRLPQVVPQARLMMDAYPDAGSFVINGVLGKLETEIDKQVQIRNASRVPVVQREAQDRIDGYAQLAVSLGEMLVDWAKSKGFEGARLMRYDRDLARALLIAGKPAEAAARIKPWIEAFPNDPSLAILAGNIFYSEGKAKGRNPDNFAAARTQYNLLINTYNAVSPKPPVYWEAWYQNLLIDDFLGGDRAKQIPGKILQLQNFDPRLGEEFFERFEALRIKHLAQG